MVQYLIIAGKIFLISSIFNFKYFFGLIGGTTIFIFSALLSMMKKPMRPSEEKTHN